MTEQTNPEVTETEEVDGSTFDLNIHIHRLLMDEPFFAALSRRMDKKASNAIPTAGVMVTEHGTLEMIASGIFSSLQEQNVRLRRAIKDPGELRQHKHFPLLFDPQTSGGLIAAIPAANVSRCLSELHQLGYPISRVIGDVTDDNDSVENITLTTQPT